MASAASSKVRKPVYYVVDMRGDEHAWPDLAVRTTRKEAIEAADRFFRSYDFKLHKRGPWDPNQAIDESIDPENPPAVCFGVFEGVKVVKGKVAEFQHFGGEGPCCRIHRTRK